MSRLACAFPGHAPLPTLLPPATVVPMTSFALPRERHGDGAHKVFAVHGWFADRSAFGPLLPDPDRLVECCLACSDPEAFRAWLDSWARDDFHDRVEGAAVPALALAGALDPAPSADLPRATRLAWYPRAEPYVPPCAGHHAMDETPLEPVRVVEGFLRADADDHAGGDERTDGPV